MRLSFAGAILITAMPLLAQANEQNTLALAKLRPVPFTSVTLTDQFWAPRQKINRERAIPHNLAMLEKSGNMKNLVLAADKATTGYNGPFFIDSDLYKGIEAAAFSLATHPDPKLDQELDRIIKLIEKAQMPDGYLNTYYQVCEPDKRWTDLRDKHELYCAGHLIEAAVAHYKSTGKRSLLNVAIKFTDHISKALGPGPEQKPGYCGHEEIELALVKLADATGEKRFFDLAKYFVDQRGSHYFAKEHGTPEAQYDGKHWQDHMPVRDQDKAVGHSVRFGYLMAAATDIARVTNDQKLLEAIGKLWENTTERRMFITGGIGSSAHNEGFTEDYDLPTFSAYQETCASVSMILWSYRLGLLHGEPKYADILERALYNGFAAGMNLDGDRYFYVNPLASKGNHHRTEWFGCACCPPNVARTLASLSGYFYAASDDALYVNQYVSSELNAMIGPNKLKARVTSGFPWTGEVQLEILEAPNDKELKLKFRVPEWTTETEFETNGKAADNMTLESGYAVMSRRWRAGDTVKLTFEMPVVLAEANPQVKECRGRLAITRGPVVYCIEDADHPEGIAGIALPPGTELVTESHPEMLGGITVLKGEGVRAAALDWDDATLYQETEEPDTAIITAIPYCVWDNRKAGAMAVWIPSGLPSTPPQGKEAHAKVSMSFSNDNCTPDAIKDGVDPVSSSEQPAQNCHWWPHKGGEEWVQYDWPEPIEISRAEIYWFDDTGRGQCRLPKSARLLIKDGAEWKPANALGAESIRKDAWNALEFKPARTSSVRLVVQLPESYSSGIHEMRIR